MGAQEDDGLSGQQAACGPAPSSQTEANMLYTIAIVLLVLWVLGMLTSVAGGLIHLLLVVAAVVILIRLFTGRKVL
ncbi:hypothetical protein MasN3_38070 [Massilia varians]|uniref:Lmo0937 family membrane protein n=1 Tax=Massilia varians TaxID=457921 RepID=A0ABM8CAL3_9BURK|nr:hypothetical protein MasN3_38070 [Massilia varians]